MRAPLAAVEMDFPVLQIEHAAEAIAAADRPVHRHRVQAEHAFDLVEQIEGIARRLIHLVDEGEHRQAAESAHLVELARLRLDTLRAVDDHHHPVDGKERPVGVFAEVLVARRVEQRQPVGAELELHRRRGHGDAAFALDVHPVRHDMPFGLAAANRAGQLDGPRVQQEFLGERGLARVRVRDDGERASALDFRAQRRTELGRRDHVCYLSSPMNFASSPPQIAGSEWVPCPRV